MTVKFASVKANLADEEKGEWKPSSKFPGVEFLVSSLQSPAYVLARDLLSQRWARKYRGKPVPLDVRHDEMGKLFAEHILHGWRGFDVEYDPAAAEAALRNREYRELLADIEQCAAEVGEAEVEYLEEAGKNSGAPSASA